jgi:hypothetical protein
MRVCFLAGAFLSRGNGEIRLVDVIRDRLRLTSTTPLEIGLRGGCEGGPDEEGGCAFFHGYLSIVLLRHDYYVDIKRERHELIFP